MNHQHIGGEFSHLLNANFPDNVALQPHTLPVSLSDAKAGEILAIFWIFAMVTVSDEWKPGNVQKKKQKSLAYWKAFNALLSRTVRNKPSGVQWQVTNLSLTNSQGSVQKWEILVDHLTLPMNHICSDNGSTTGKPEAPTVINACDAGVQTFSVEWTAKIVAPPSTKI